MTPTPYYFASLYRSTKDAWDVFQRATDFLPRRTNEPYHSGPHNYQRFRMVWDLLHPRHVVEIGFNLGHSAVIWLSLGAAHVHSIEVTWTAARQKAVDDIQARYPNRFTIHWTHSRKAIEMGEVAKFGGQPGVIFIDGSHERDWVRSDILLGKALNAPYFLMDDYDSHHGAGVIQAVEDENLIPVAVFGTMALCRPDNLFTKYSDPLGGNYYQ